MKLKRVLSLLIIIVTVISTVAFAEETTFIQDVLNYYDTNSDLTSWWDVVALWGAEKDIKNYTLPTLTSDSINENSSATDYAGAIFSLIAQGKNVHDIWQRDLAHELSLKQDRETGAFGAYPNIQAYSILALDASKEEYQREKALSYLVSFEAEGGGFGYTKDSADTDLTAMVILALYDSPYTDVVYRAIDYLKSVQLQDGGFESWGVENSNTLETVISALSTYGKLDDPDFIKGGKTLLDKLYEYRLQDGSFSYALGGENNLMATQQGLIALGDVISGKSVFLRLKSQFECEKATVKVRIEGIEDNILNEEVTVKGSLNVLNAIKKALDRENISYNIEKSQYGAYIKGINGEVAGKFGGWDGWLFLVNGISASESADSIKVNDGDYILLYYGMFEPDTLIPKISAPNTVKAGKRFTVKVSSSYYDWNDNAEKEVFIENATVEINGEKYSTDKNGEAEISVLTPGDYEIKVYKNNISSYPSIVRSEPFYISVEKQSSPQSGGFRTEVKEEQKEITGTNKKEAEPFLDENEVSDWAKDSVKKAQERNLIEGDHQKFNPKSKMTRAEFATVMCRVLELEEEETEPFDDVKKTDWYYDSVQKVKKYGIMDGVGENKFEALSYITREQMAVIICRAYNLKSEGENIIKDFDIVSSWAKDSVKTVYSLRLMQGDNKEFLPLENVSREMCVTVLIRTLEVLER